MDPKKADIEDKAQPPEAHGYGPDPDYIEEAAASACAEAAAAESRDTRPHTDRNPAKQPEKRNSRS